MKPFFSNKGNFGPNIKLVEKNELLQNDQETADELNTFLKKTVSNLEINENSHIINQISDFRPSRKMYQEVSISSKHIIYQKSDQYSKFVFIPCYRKK